MCLKLIAIVSFIQHKIKRLKKKRSFFTQLSSFEHWSRWISRGIKRWGINGRVSPRIFYKLMSMRPAIYPVTPEVPGTMKHAYNLRVRKRHKRATWGEDRPSEKKKKCFRPYVDFLPHCKVTPIHPSVTGRLFYRQYAPRVFFLLLSLLVRPPRDCVRDTGGVNSGCHE